MRLDGFDSEQPLAVAGLRARLVPEEIVCRFDEVFHLSSFLQQESEGFLWINLHAARSQRQHQSHVIYSVQRQRVTHLHLLMQPCVDGLQLDVGLRVCVLSDE